MKLENNNLLNVLRNEIEESGKEGCSQCSFKEACDNIVRKNNIDICILLDCVQ